MRPDIFEYGDSVLLLGEGNFSFSVGLLNLELGIKLTATCFESSLSKNQAENCELLKSHGMVIVTGVDATKVHEHSLLKTKKFDKIIFNFPHTGGKMKIHRNRELLRDFFLSASNLLVTATGSVIVSLCRGQGADYAGKRVWGDSWQVVDMAGHASLLLVECSPFEWSLFPSYSNVGYRCLEKGFHSEDGVVHRFLHVDDSLSSQVESVVRFYLNEMTDDLISRPFFSRMLNRDILRNDLNPSAFILQKLVDYVSLKLTCCHHIESKVFRFVPGENDFASATDLWMKSGSDILFYSFYIHSQATIDWEKSPITMKTLLIGKDSCGIFMTAISELMTLFQITDFEVTTKGRNPSAHGTHFVFQRSSKCDGILLAETYLSNQGGVTQSICMVDVNAIVFEMFSLNSWKQVWAKNVHVTISSGKPSISGICPHPVCYTFDLSFFVEKSFTEERFFELLWDMAGEVVTNVVKVSEFYSMDDRNRSLCFRMSYLSYEHPMCRKSVLYFHQNVLGRGLERILGVRIK